MNTENTVQQIEAPDTIIAEASQVMPQEAVAIAVADDKQAAEPEEEKAPGREPLSLVEAPSALHAEALAPKKAKPAAAKPPKAPTRATRTVAFSLEEDEYIQQILEARQAAGLSENMNQMLRQALNFAFNHEPSWVFGVPKQIKKIHFVK